MNVGIGVFSVILALGFYIGFFFWPYWIIGKLLITWAKGPLKRRPVALFASGFGAIVGWVILFYGTLLIFLQYLRSMATLIGLILILSGIAGAVGWIILYVKYRSEKTSRERFEREHPVPKLHLWMQDLYAAAFCFGGYMAVQTINMNQQYNYMDYMVYVLAAYVLLAASCGLYFALDVCRRSLRVQRPLWRFLFVVLVVVATAFTFLIPVWLMWRAWRKALFHGDWSIGQDLWDKQRKEAAAQATPEANTAPAEPALPSSDLP